MSLSEQVSSGPSSDDRKHVFFVRVPGFLVGIQFGLADRSINVYQFRWFCAGERKCIGYWTPGPASVCFIGWEDVFFFTRQVDPRCGAEGASGCPMSTRAPSTAGRVASFRCGFVSCTSCSLPCGFLFSCTPSACRVAFLSAVRPAACPSRALYQLLPRGRCPLRLEPLSTPHTSPRFMHGQRPAMARIYFTTAAHPQHSVQHLSSAGP